MSLISQGAVGAFSGRLVRKEILFTNTTGYTSYRLTFPTVANSATADSMQIAEVELLGRAVSGVNHAPTVSALQNFTVTAGQAANFQFTGTPFSDGDSAKLTVTLSIDDGALTVRNVTGITLGGTDKSRTFFGAVSALNDYFKTAGNISYTIGNSNLAARKLTVLASDGFLSAGTTSLVTVFVADSGLTAKNLVLDIDQQLLVAGFLKGTQSIRATTGGDILFGFDLGGAQGAEPAVRSTGTVSLTAGGKIQKVAGAKMNLVAGALELMAQQGIDVEIAASQLIASTSTGNLVVKESTFASDNPQEMGVTLARALQGSVTIQSMNRLVVTKAIAAGTDAKADITSRLNNVAIVGPTLTAVFEGTSFIGLHAGKTLELPAIVDGKSVLLESGDPLTLSSAVTVTKKLELISDSSVFITGNISSPSAELAVTARGIKMLPASATGQISIKAFALTAASVQLRAPNSVLIDTSSALSLRGFVGGLSGFDRTGSIEFRSGGTLSLADGIFAARDLAKLTATRIESGVGPMLIAAETRAESAGDISLRLWTDRLTARSTGLGNITISEADALVAQEVTAQNGRIVISARGNLTASNVRVMADEVGNDITLSSTGDIFVDKVVAGELAGGQKAHSQVTLDAFGTIKEPANAIDNTTALVDVDAWKITLKHGSPIPAPVIVNAAGVTGSGDEIEVASVLGITDGNTSVTRSITESIQGNYVLVAPVVTGDLVLTATGSLVILAFQTPGAQKNSFASGIEATNSGASQPANPNVALLGGANRTSLAGVNPPGQNITLSSGGDMTSLAGIDVGTASVTLKSGGKITFQDTITAGDLILAAGGDVALNTNVGRISIVATPGSRIQIDNQGSLTLGASSSAGADVTVRAGGNLTISGPLTAGNLNLTTGGSIIVGGMLDVGPKGTISLVVAGSIEISPQGIVRKSILNIAPAVFTAGHVILSAENGIGVNAPIEMTASELTVTTTAGDIRINNRGDLTVHQASALDGSVELSVIGSILAENISAAGAGHKVTLSASSSGDVAVGSVSAIGGDIKITSAGAIFELGSDAEADLVASRLELRATNGIGAQAVIGIETSVLRASASNGNLRLSNQGDLLVKEAVTQDGSIDLSVAGNLTGEIIRAHSKGSVNLSTTDSGNITVGLVTATGSKLTVNSSGSIDELGTDPTPDFVAAEVELSANSGIGVEGSIEILAFELRENSSEGEVQVVNQWQG